MAELENTVVETVEEKSAPVAETQEPAVEAAQNNEGKKNTGFGKFKAGLKEWFRKFLVNLKRNPQRITFIMLFIVSALWLIWLFTFSRTIFENSGVEWCGLVVFVNTLLSILILALFLNAFPKRKKPNKVFIALLFAFMAAMIACDILYYLEMNNYIFNISGRDPGTLEKTPYMLESLNLAIAHIVLIGVCAILLATLPLYRKLIMKINTRKEIESTDLKEEIDTSESE